MLWSGQIDKLFFFLIVHLLFALVDSGEVKVLISDFVTNVVPNCNLLLLLTVLIRILEDFNYFLLFFDVDNHIIFSEELFELFFYFGFISA